MDMMYIMYLKSCYEIEVRYGFINNYALKHLGVSEL